MDNLVIQVQGDNKIKVEALVYNILNNLGLKKGKLKIIEKEENIDIPFLKRTKLLLMELKYLGLYVYL